MHKTPTGEMIKLVRAEAKQTKKALSAVSRACELGQDLTTHEDALQAQVDEAKAQAAALKASGKARLEDLNVYTLERARGKNKNVHSYWYASWREEDKVKNIYLGTCKKLDQDTAWRKARDLKAQALGICGATK
jgi:hypothetical protein